MTRVNTGSTPTMQHFCTYFDHNYLLRGLTMYRSLLATGYEFVLHVLTLDDETHRCITSLGMDNLHAIKLADLEAANPDLASAKESRTRIEYYFTLTPFLPLHVLEIHPEIDLITYVDADLYFYQPPAPIFEELGERSILICEHRYSPRLHDKQLPYGIYNVQFQTFRRDTMGLACLHRWRDQCQAWCFDRIEGDRYADQKYLDEWPQRYGENLAILQHPGAGLAPWNWESSALVLRAGKVTAREQPLIFYHFHGVKVLGAHLLSNGLADWGVMPYRLLRWFYAGYLRKLRTTRDWVHTTADMTFPLKDNVIRGAGVRWTSTGEILRKAWSQLMFVH